MSRPPQTPRMGPPKISTTKVTTKTTKTTSRVVPADQQAQPGPSSRMTRPLTPSTGTIPKQPPKPKEFSLPAFSIMGEKQKHVETELEKLKKKNIRRVVGEGEDLKMIKEVLKDLRDKDILVQEFIMKISPYTADNGDCLRQVMNDELASFKKLATKVYETMTQDVSDVLTNEHAELIEYLREKTDFFNSKTVQCISELFEICPKFSFEKYYSDDKNLYLQSLFPIPEEEEIDPEEMEMLIRQQLYHRMQWLRAEGDRLNEENRLLKKRFAELKRQQQEQFVASSQAIEQAEERNRQLVQTEAHAGQRFEGLTGSLEQNIVEQESRRTAEPRAKPTVVKKVSKKKVAVQRPEWNVAAATEIESAALQQAVQTEASKASTSQSKIKKKIKRTPGAKKSGGGFHFSPIKTPPSKQQEQKQTSPFHYSPPKTPPEERLPAPTETTRVETTTVITEEPASAARQPQRMGRRSATAPRDSWGGFG